MSKKYCTFDLLHHKWGPQSTHKLRWKRVETLFSQLVDQFMVHRNYAKQQVGLFARIISKVSATTILQYINFISNKPIGRIKYALV